MTPKPKEEPLTEVQKLILDEVSAIGELLLEKNRGYGNSALEPMGIFAKGDAQDLLRVRVDDKLNRIKNMGPQSDTEDTEQDLLGYLVLMRVERRYAQLKKIPKK